MVLSCLPPHHTIILQSINPSLFPLHLPYNGANNLGLQFPKNRMSCCPKCQEKESKYRILQSDLEFEIKKMTEDLASQKVTLEMHYQKESKKMAQRFTREKGQRDEENRKWMQKYDQIVAHYEASIAQLRKEHQGREKEIESVASSRYSQKEQDARQSYEATLKKLQSTSQATIQSLQAQMHANCVQAAAQKAKELAEMKRQHEAKLEEVVVAYEQRVKHLKQEISAGTQRMEKLKLQAHQKQTLLYEELYLHKQEISNLKYSVDQLNTAIRRQEHELQMKEKQIETVRLEAQARMRQQQENWQRERAAMMGDFSRQLQDMLKEKLEECCKFEQVVKEIQVKRDQDMRLYESGLKEVQGLVQERPSREEDVQQISLLKDLLNQKERQFQKALNEAKGYRLELNNKEEIFSKIFCSHSPLNIEKIGKRKDSKLTRTASALKHPSAPSNNTTGPTHYQSVGTLHSLPGGQAGRKEKLVLQPRSTKFF